MEKETDVIENMKNTRVHSPSEDIWFICIEYLFVMGRYSQMYFWLRVKVKVIENVNLCQLSKLVTQFLFMLYLV